MADDTTTSGNAPIPPARRKLLQQRFEHGSRSSAKGDWDYANEMFSHCVVEDPGNRMYVQSFLGNLQKKYNNDKKGSKLAGVRSAGSKAAMRVAAKQKKWRDVIAGGVKCLELNPWDTGALVDMAHACAELECPESQVVLLRGALEADLKDPEINRLLGRALDKQGQFDQASICFQRVLAAKPQDEEARRAVADLACKKTIHTGGYEEAESSTEVMADKQSKAERMGLGGPRVTPEQQLEKAIAKDPTNLSNYQELADLHGRNEQFDKAEEVLTRGLAASGGDLNVQERLEDVQLKRLRQQLDIGLRRQQSEPGPESDALVARLKEELNNRELEVYRKRCERYPTQLHYKYELGMRLKHAGKFKEAVQVLQEARADPRRKGAVMLAIGECFQKLEQFRLATSSFEQAVQDISDRDLDLKKEALYRAGRLQLYLAHKNLGGDLDKAEKQLTDLAGMDFGYKDVSSLLDRIRKMRHKG
jgi:tetratricopeptide (TPR) repeat protein